MFYWPAPNFAVEAIQHFGPNVVGFQLATGDQRWYILGCYVSTYNTLTIYSVLAALKERPHGARLLVTGDFNAKLSELEGIRRGEDIAAELEAEVMEDMLAHFLPFRSSWCWDGRTWSMIQEGREVRSQTDYILGTDLRLFWNVSVRDPMHKSYHFMVLGCLRSNPLMENSKYLSWRKRLPLRPKTALTREDGIFEALRRAVPNPQARDARNMRGYRRPRGDSSTRESPRADIQQRTRLSFGGCDAPLWKVYREIGDNG